MKKQNKRIGFRHQPGPFMNGSTMVQDGPDGRSALKPRRLRSNARKRHYSLGLPGLLLIALAFLAAPSTLLAQSESDVNALYNQHRETKDCISFSFNKQMLDAIDMDVDWNQYTKNVQGDFENIKLIVYQNYKEGVEHLKDIENTVQDWGFGPVSIPEEKDIPHDKIKVYSKMVDGYYRHVFLMVQDQDEDEVIFLVFKGKLTVKEV